jgi:hypothetical protein
MKLNKFKFFFILILIFFLFSLFNSFVLAEERGLEIKYPIINGIEITATSTIGTYAIYLFSLAMIIGAILAFAVLIYGGFRYVTSAGNPLAMRDAKNWIFGGILGLVLLLCSWLILNIINPGLTQPKVEELKPVGGIYLINEEKEKRYFYSTDLISEIPEDFKAVQIEFISDKPVEEEFFDPNKEELYSIFYYSENNQGGTEKEIKNPGAGSIVSISDVKSIYFFWQKPGVYLYEKDFLETPPMPKVYAGSQKTLKDFSDKAVSMRIVNEKMAPIWITPILFEDTDYEGMCDISIIRGRIADRLKNKVSSIIVSQGMTPYGEVIFYDKINCEMEDGKEPYVYTTIGPDPDHITKEKTKLDQWLSIKINGNFSVLLNTEEDLKGKCSVFSKVGCIPSFKGTSVYSADPEGLRPVDAWIFPTIE